MSDSAQFALIQGASGGVGRALVERALSSGRFERLFVTSRSATSLMDWGDERVTPIELDLSSDESISAAAERVIASCPHLNLLITTAGLLHDEARGISPEKRLSQLKRSSLEALFEVNCYGPFLWYQALMPLLRHRAPLKLATLSARVGSISDNRLGGWYGYRASKAAQNMMTKTLSLELARQSPQSVVVGLHPGTVQTELSAPFQARVPPERLFSPERSAAALWSVLEALTPEQSGRCFAWDGSEISP